MYCTITITNAIHVKNNTRAASLGERFHFPPRNGNEIFTRDFVVSLYPFVVVFFFFRQNRWVMTQKNGTDSRSHAHSSAARPLWKEFPRLGSGGTSRRERTHTTMNTLAQVRAMRRRTTDDGRRGCATTTTRTTMKTTRMHDAWRDGSMIMERGNRRNEWNAETDGTTKWDAETNDWLKEGNG